MNRIAYEVSNDDGELLASGTKEECLETLGIDKKEFKRNRANLLLGRDCNIKIIRTDSFDAEAKEQERYYMRDKWNMMRWFRERLFELLGMELPYAENPYHKEME